MADEPKNFWSSIQGILTGVAAVITAGTGLYIAINANSSSAPPKIANVEVIESPSVHADKMDNTNNSNLDTSITAMKAEDIARLEEAAQKAHDNLPASNMNALLDCQLFPSVNSVTSLMSWSEYYHKQIVAAQENKDQLSSACDKTINYRGMAHCKAPNDLNVRQALFETMTLCRAGGIEWTDIKHSKILK